MNLIIGVDWLAWFNDHSSAIQAFAAIAIVFLTLALILITWYYARLTRKLVLANELDIKQKTRPYPKVSIRREMSSSEYCFITVTVTMFNAVAVLEALELVVFGWKNRDPENIHVFPTVYFPVKGNLVQVGKENSLQYRRDLVAENIGVRGYALLGKVVRCAFTDATGHHSYFAVFSEMFGREGQHGTPDEDIEGIARQMAEAYCSLLPDEKI